MSVAYERDVERIDGRSLSVLIEARNGTEWRLVCVVDGLLVWEREVTKRATTKHDATNACSQCGGDGTTLHEGDYRAFCYECRGTGRAIDATAR